MKKIALAFAALIGVSAPAMADTPILGQVLIWAGTFCPQGYLAMNGQILPISPNAALFTLLGTTYGGDGVSNFGLPNAKPIFTATRATFMQCIATQGIYPVRP